jgi:3-oxoacyl-[acyl-carrier-protein] synthase II
MGAVSACGWGVPALERALHAGNTEIRPLRRFDTTGQRTRVGGEVPPVPEEVRRAFPEWRRLSWADRFALAASREAVSGASLPESLEALEVGVFFASSTGGMPEAERWFAQMIRDPVTAHPGALGSQQVNGPGDAVARRLRVCGPVETLSSACASGALALGAALSALRRGEVELAVAGGADALCLTTYAGFNALRSVDEAPCRPFRGSRAGLSLGEGAGVLVLETAASARRRGVAALAEVAGAGASCDAYHMTAPIRTGRRRGGGPQALEDAGLDSRRGGLRERARTGTPHNDAAEWSALRGVLGERAACVPVEATKALVGHLLGSAGALEAVVTVLGLRRACPRGPGDEAVDPGHAGGAGARCPRSPARSARRPLPQPRLRRGQRRGGLTSWTGP